MENRQETIDLIKSTRPHLEVTDVGDWSKARWLDYRMGGLGCSELGTILGHNKYSEAAVVFAQKTGIVPAGTVDNQIMGWGRILEPIIVDIWQHYNPDIPTWEETESNRSQGIIIRKAMKPEIYVRNPKYPFLFGGPDGLFKHEGDLGVLEIKTISSMAADVYETGIPTSYVFQIMGYMMLFETEYAEITMLKDGRNFEVIPIERNDMIVDQIENECGEFWHRVEQAKELIEDGVDFTHLEPKPTDTAVYESFLKERFRADAGTEIDPTNTVEFWVQKYLSFSKQEKEKEARKRYYSNKLKYFMGDAEVMDCDTAKVTWREGKRGRAFRVNEKK